MVFGDSKIDKTQAKQIAEILGTLKNHWSWIVHLDGRLKKIEANQKIMIRNNNRFIQIHKELRGQVQALNGTIAEMQKVDADFKARLAGLGNMGATEPTETET